MVEPGSAPPTRQSDLPLAGVEKIDGYQRWLVGRRMAAHELARRLGLPLGHAVEVWLTGGIRLRGMLRLAEGVLFVEEEQLRHLLLRVDNIEFSYREIESCVRLV